MINQFFEQIGSFFLSKKNLRYISIMASFIIAAFFFVNVTKYYEFLDKETRFVNILNSIEDNLEKRKQFKDFISQKEMFDPYYIDKNLESLVFLEDEVSSLTNLHKHVAFTNNSNIKERINFLAYDNKLKFCENDITLSNNLREVEEIGSPIEINERDLKTILKTIEDVNIDEIETIDNKPQLIITKFELHKKNNNHFVLNLNLFKREFLKKKDPNEK